MVVFYSSIVTYTIYGTHRRTTTDTDTDRQTPKPSYIRTIYGTHRHRHRRTLTFKSFFYPDRYADVSTRIRKMPVWEIFRKLALLPGNVRTYPKVCVGKRLEYRYNSLSLAKNAKKPASSDTGIFLIRVLTQIRIIEVEGFCKICYGNSRFFC